MALSSAVQQVVDDYLDNGGDRPTLLLIVRPHNRITPSVDGADDLPSKLYFSEAGQPPYHTGSGDTPANTRFIPRVTQFSNVRTDLLKDGAPGSLATTSVGNIRINVAHDGTGQDSDTLEALVSEYVWPGARWEILIGGDGITLANFDTLSMGTVKDAEWDDTELILTVRGRFDSFDDPVTTNIETYAGTGGEEGGEELAGVRKPFGVGDRMYNVEGQRLGLNSEGQILYQFNSISAAHAAYNGTVDAITSAIVYDGGDILTADTDYTLDTDTGIVTLLGSEPVYKLTADLEIEWGYTPQHNDRDNIIKAVLDLHSDGEFTSSDVDIESGDFTTSSEGGGFVAVHFGSDEWTIAELIERIMRPCGMAWQTRAGDLHLQWLDEPAEQTPDVTLDWRDIQSIQRLKTAPPVWSLRYGWGRNYTIQDPDELANGGEHQNADLGPEFASHEYRYRTLQDPAIRDYDEDENQIRAREVEVNTGTTYLGVNPGDSGGGDIGTHATAESNRFWRVFMKPRDIYRVTLRRKWFYAEMGDTVELAFEVPLEDGSTYSRFGFDTSGEIQLEDGSGGIQLEDGTGNILLEGETHRRFMVVGTEEDFDRGEFALTLWG